MSKKPNVPSFAEAQAAVQVLIAYGRQSFKPNIQIPSGTFVGKAISAVMPRDIVDVASEMLEDQNHHLAVACLDAVCHGKHPTTHVGRTLTIALPESNANRDNPEPSKTLVVKRWLVVGELDKSDKNSDAILETAGTILDDHCSGEIFGQNVFEATNGKFYQLQVQGQIIELTKEEADEIVQENE